MYTDPIVEEVHEIRAKISEENDGDLKRIYQQALEYQRKLSARVVHASTTIKDEPPEKGAA